MDFIKLFNEVIKLAKPVTAEDSFAKELSDKFHDLELDSLDYIMLYMYFGDIYGISEEKMREFSADTIGEFKDFLEANATKKPETAEEAIAGVK